MILAPQVDKLRGHSIDREASQCLCTAWGFQSEPQRAVTSGPGFRILTLFFCQIASPNFAKEQLIGISALLHVWWLYVPPSRDSTLWYLSESKSRMTGNILTERTGWYSTYIVLYHFELFVQNVKFRKISEIPKKFENKKGIRTRSKKNSSVTRDGWTIRNGTVLVSWEGPLS